ncbi:hypothetical protein EU527_07790 [Candidatus Thorarchaeota archaeon]|nr:MAG: hypothetical protein EU527_07790 [Candidatus Thorarchaeota archaeon]
MEVARIPEWRTGILLIVVILSGICPFYCGDYLIGDAQQHSLNHIQSLESMTQQYSHTADTDELLFEDNFTSIPLGFDISIWNLSTHSNPSITWENKEWSVLEAEPISYSILESVIETGYNVIAEFKITFTEGLCYFGIGWSDKILDSENEWQANLRLSQNAVFIDYWDNELCLVTYCNGNRIAAPVEHLSLRNEHEFRLEWHPTLVKLLIDNEEKVVISRMIPQISLPFIIATSGHHERSGSDRLAIDFVKVSSVSSIDLLQPEINLIWPLNGSEITHHDYIDLEIRGSIGQLFYSWDGQDNETIDAPWDFAAPNQIGTHKLEVFTENILGVWSSKTYYFGVFQHQLIMTCPKMRGSPLIDGVINSGEQQQSAIILGNIMNENRDFEEMTMYISFPEESLYIGIETKLPDRWNSRISLLIDGDGDNIWDADVTLVPEDICVTVGTPSSYGSLCEVFSASGNKLSNSLFPGMIASSSADEHGSTIELLFNLTNINGNATKGIGIGIVISRGGYDSFYPAYLGYGIFSELLIIRSSDVYNPNSLNLLYTVSGSVAVLLIVIFISLYVVSTKRAVSLNKTLDDDDLERVKTLLYSYDKISIDRLTRLLGFDRSLVEKLVRKLVSRGLVDISIIEFEQGYIRNLSEFKKGSEKGNDGGEVK